MLIYLSPVNYRVGNTFCSLPWGHVVNSLVGVLTILYLCLSLSAFVLKRNVALPARERYRVGPVSPENFRLGPTPFPLGAIPTQRAIQLFRYQVPRGKVVRRHGCSGYMPSSLRFQAQDMHLQADREQNVIHNAAGDIKRV